VFIHNSKEFNAARRWMGCVPHETSRSSGKQLLFRIWFKSRLARRL
jgi:hypothetical protein